LDGLFGRILQTIASFAGYAHGVTVSAFNQGVMLTMRLKDYDLRPTSGKRQVAWTCGVSFLNQPLALPWSIRNTRSC
jgi:hypothetical protein